MSVQKPASPPVVLILGGTTTVARALATYLSQEDRASFVRIADRFSVNPPTTYLDHPFLDLLKAPSSKLEYKQVNLANVERHRDLFTPPSTWSDKETGWKRFDLVFDLTGEIAFDRPELIQISNTYQLALSLAKSASKLDASTKPGAYVRLTFPFYEMKSTSSGHSEGDRLRPDGVRGRWWHEAMRGIASVDGLNVGFVRCAAWYGIGTWEGEVIPRLVAGHVYYHLKEKMEFLYNSDLRVHTVHTIDIAQSLYLTGLYLLSTPRSSALSQSGADIPFSFTPAEKPAFSLGSGGSSAKRTSMSETWKTIDTVVPEKQSVSAPLFNVVDDGDSTQESLAKAVAAVWGVKYGFHSSTVASLAQQFAKTSFSEMIEDVNEMHVEAWAEMLAKSDPPILSSPISPYLDEHAFRKTSICLDGTKARKVLGFKPTKPRVEVEELRTIAKGFQEDNIWPKLT